jgi:hypothetical protein
VQVELGVRDVAHVPPVPGYVPPLYEKPDVSADELIDEAFTPPVFVTVNV